MVLSRSCSRLSTVPCALGEAGEERKEKAEEQEQMEQEEQEGKVEQRKEKAEEQEQMEQEEQEGKVEQRKEEGEDDEAAYARAVGGALPARPSADEIAADPSCRYAMVRAYKEAGNALFKEGRYAWAKRTYALGVSLLIECYASYERLKWDYEARVPCAQCLSNGAMCALKLGEAEEAARLSEEAAACGAEGSDLVKALLRRAEALLLLGRAAEAAEAARRAAEKEPRNRAAAEVSARARKAARQAEAEAERRLFGGVDLRRAGLKSRKEEEKERCEEEVERAMGALYAGRDEEAVEALLPLSGREGSVGLRAAYGAGIGCYHTGRMEEAAQLLAAYFKRHAEAAEEPPPLGGVPLARFCLAHALYSCRKPSEAREQLLRFVEEAEAAGPQKVLNLPDGWMGRKISEAERGASRLRARACSDEARADALTMLALIDERASGPAAAVGHLERAAAHADKGGVMAQAAEAHDNLANAYEAMGESAKAREHRERAHAAREAAAKKAAKDEERRMEEEKAKEVNEELKDEGAQEEAEAEGEAERERDEEAKEGEARNE
ncbi:hypothetical protein AB1Y20_003476 [Prymnesium parvum]|uniref:Uncharacterized protein n=1 Tax=Prymnesium parvum TaxID=97485 RepID=A0AB34JEL9_PRYPA